jgi:hypothetical protein
MSGEDFLNPIQWAIAAAKVRRLVEPGRWGKVGIWLLEIGGRSRERFVRR